MSRRAVLGAVVLAIGTARAGAFTLTSTAIADGATIPVVHTCSGADRSPPLRWSDPPAAVKAFAVTVDDPDAPSGTFRHWTVYDLPADVRALPEGGAGGGVEAGNSFGRSGWRGPCPPPGAPHRYVFTVIALSAKVDLPAGADVAAVRRRIDELALGRAQLVGRFGR